MGAAGEKLEIRVLGRFSVARGGDALSIGSRSAQVLLAYLALSAGSRHRRERLTGLLWPDASEESARQNLRNALWTLRKTLGEEYFLADKLTVGFDAGSNFELDAAALEGGANGSTDELAAAVSNYGGELLPGFYDEWVLLERERLRAVFDRLTGQLVEALLTDGRAHAALDWAERWIAYGQAPEPAYRALMSAHHLLGDQAGLANAYRRCIHALEEELGVEPSPETEALYRRLTENAAQEPRPPLAGPISPVLPAFLSGAEERRQPSPRVVGREPELERLSGFLDEALSGRGRSVFVTGEAGQGKTSLLSEFSRRAQSAHDALVVAVGHCNAFTGSGDPLLPFRDILEMLTGDVESKWLAGTIGKDQAERLWRLLPQAVDAIVGHAPELLNGFLRQGPLLERASASDPDRRLEALLLGASRTTEARGQTKEVLFDAYARVLRAISASHPLVLLVEDLHWADASSIALLFHLSRRLSGSRILLAGSLRTEELVAEESSESQPLLQLISEVERLEGSSRIDLNAAHSGRAFIDTLLDSEPNRLGSEFRDRLESLTEGNPLFAVELLEEMKTGGGLLRDESGRWVEGPGLSWRALPARVEGVIRTRVDRLDSELREALIIGSVEGGTFTSEVVARVLGVDERQLARRLSVEAERRHQLVEGLELLRVGGRRLGRYRFRHNLFQQYLYNGLSPLDRALLHEDVGSALEELHAEDTREIAVDLARHFEEGGLVEKAVSYLVLAGERAVGLSAYEEAGAHFRRGLELLAELPPSRETEQRELELNLLLGPSLQAIHGFAVPEIAAVYERARELAQRLGAVGQQFTSVWSLSLYHSQRAQFAKAAELGEELLRLASEEGDERLLLQAHHAIWFAAFCLGDFESVLEHARKGVWLYRADIGDDPSLRYGGHDAGVCAHLFAGRALWYLGCPDEVREEGRRALAIANGLVQPNSMAHAFSHAAELHLLLGEGERVLELAESCRAVAEGNGLTFWAAWGTILQGCALVQLGETEKGIEAIHRGRREYPGIGVVEEVSLWARLAEAYLELGEVEEGLRSIANGFEAAERLDGEVWLAELHRLRGELLALHGDQGTGARDELRRSLEISRRHGSKALELRAATSYCRTMLGCPGEEEARRELAQAYAWFGEGLETADLKKAKDLLAA